MSLDKAKHALIREILSGLSRSMKREDDIARDYAVKFIDTGDEGDRSYYEVCRAKGLAIEQCINSIENIGKNFNPEDYVGDNT